MPYHSKSILVVAGEVSGDIHLAKVVKEMKALREDLHFFGSGGDKMKEQGVELLAHIKDLSVMGFTGLPRLLPRLYVLKNSILKRVAQEKVPLAILTDYPGFNLTLARSLKRLHHPPRVLYYIAPQVWAWNPQRARQLKQYTDGLAVVFSFEVPLFHSLGGNVRFVGHPLLDDISNNPIHPSTHRPIDLALLPGSRVQVVKSLLPYMITTAEIVKNRFPLWRIGLSQRGELPAYLFQNLIRDYPWLELFTDSHHLLSQSRYALIASGTASLEAALLGTPQVVVYRTSVLNYLIAQRLVKLPFISLVNILSSTQLVPELIQHHFQPETAASFFFNW
ncbi:MAG: lipid-A-disaccharide synthase [bacterium]